MIVNTGAEQMIIDFDTASSPIFVSRHAYADTSFATVLTQYAAPLFAPWPTAEQNIRSNPGSVTAKLNAHPATSNRREGRHPRG